MDGPKLAEAFDIGAVKVINDFAAVGYGVLDLKDDEIVTLNEGAAADARGPVAVLGPGTGLGEAMLFWNDERAEYDVVLEGSHADLRAARRDAARAPGLLRGDPGRVARSSRCCGSGIVRIYDSLKEHRGAGDKPELTPRGSRPPRWTARAPWRRRRWTCSWRSSAPRRRTWLKRLATGGADDRRRHPAA